jgi:acetylornithine/N-succinyldiaminopimelate aminotransferase
VPGFHYAKFGDLASVQALLTPQVGAILVEVVQGEGGVRMAQPGFFRDLRQLCDAHGMLLLLDEVQTGFGRTGTFFGFEQEGVVPDAISLAKALGGGVPIGAMVARDAVAQALTPGSHATTFGANALASYAGRAMLAIFQRDRLVQRSAEMGAYLLQKLHAAFDGKPYVRDVRGRGLMCGVEITTDPKAVVEAARARGFLFSVAGTHVLRLTPPLIVDRSHCDLAVERLLAACESVAGAGREE